MSERPMYGSIVKSILAWLLVPKMSQGNAFMFRFHFLSRWKEIISCMVLSIVHVPFYFALFFLRMGFLSMII